MLAFSKGGGEIETFHSVMNLSDELAFLRESSFQTIFTTFKVYINAFVGTFVISHVFFASIFFS